MRKVLFIFVLCVCSISCNTFKLEHSSEEPVYRIEAKTKLNDIYYIKVSRLDNPTILEVKPIGYATWNKLNNGNTLDKNYRFVK